MLLRKVRSLKRIKSTRNVTPRSPPAPPGYYKKPEGGVTMGPISSITTAPVAIGNSIRGSKTISIPTRNGVDAIGRDFMFTPIGSGSVTTWTMVGGSPLTPAAFSDSTLRQYMQMYQKFKWKRLVVHYITSSPTSSNGDVMFYYGKNRASVFLNQTSSQLLPFVMSDPNTVIGPQWTNHSAEVDITADWKTTDYGMTQDIEDDSTGELFLLSKTSTTDSPGYIVFDYEIEFKDMQITPRLLTLPIPRIQYSQVNIGLTAGVVTNLNTVFTVATGNNLSGSPSIAPTGAVAGDIYKLILDITNSNPAGWVNITASTGFKHSNNGFYNNMVLVDGTTLYSAYANSQWQLYTTLANAITGTFPIVYGVTATVTFNMQVWISYVTSLDATNYNPNF